MIDLTVKIKNEIHKISVDETKTVLQALNGANIGITAPCNGRGTCGKCNVYVVSESKEELACRLFPKENMEIALLCDEEYMQTATEFIPHSDETQEINSNNHVDQQRKESNISSDQEKKYMVAVDLGTTTVVMQLLCHQNSSLVLQTVSTLNPQRSYGTDVITRITAANQGASHELSIQIRQLFSETLKHFCLNNSIQQGDIAYIAIAGNTTMLHLLREWDVSGLGTYPFRPANLEREEFSYGVLEKGMTEAKEVTMEEPRVILFPGISAFVGADIVAGLYAIDFHKSEKINLFVDLGTNGELAIGNKDNILVTSTAAGPAFEGGNISCGVGSIPGAINEVTIKRNYVSVHTIDHKPAIGICGTGAIELLAELLKKGYIDEYGTLIEAYRESGFSLEVNPLNKNHKLYFTQEDIRQMQLAKAAIRAGIDTLINEYGIRYCDISNLYLAGGMGVGLNIEKACRIGLFPTELKDKIIVVGNSSLGGIKKYLQHMILSFEDYEAMNKEIVEIAKKTKTIQLAKEQQFTDHYLAYMNFPSNM